MVLLSEQQLVDCADAFDNHGCNGGLPSHAFEYIANSGGLDTESAYPYLAHESGTCSFAKDGIGAGVMRSVNITFQDEAELLEAVGNTGPVSVAFQVTAKPNHGKMMMQMLGTDSLWLHPCPFRGVSFVGRQR